MRKKPGSWKWSADRTDLKDSGYSSEGGSRLVMQTRPDDSKTLRIVTSQLIDATGRPLHGEE